MQSAMEFLLVDNYFKQTHVMPMPLTFNPKQNRKIRTQLTFLQMNVNKKQSKPKFVFIFTARRKLFCFVRKIACIVRVKIWKSSESKKVFGSGRTFASANIQISMFRKIIFLIRVMGERSETAFSKTFHNLRVFNRMCFAFLPTSCCLVLCSPCEFIMMEKSLSKC